jgi:hypothetical protein
MTLSIHFLDLIKFERLRDDNEYLLKVIDYVDGRWIISVDDTKDIEFFLNKNRIRYKIK